MVMMLVVSVTKELIKSQMAVLGDVWWSAYLCVSLVKL